MFDISIPWSVVLLMAPIFMPWLCIPAALLASVGWYRRKRNLYSALLAAFVATFAAPWTLLLAAAVFGWSRHLSPLSTGVLGVLGVLASVGLVLWAVHRAGSRN